jgi:glutamate formiminotransferase
LTNSASKTAEFLRQKTTTKTIFEGTYTAKKQDIYLNEFEIVNAKTGLALGDDVTFYLSIDGEEVASETIKYNASATSYS